MDYVDESLLRSEQVYVLLKCRKKELISLSKKIEAEMLTMPQGMLHIVKRREEKEGCIKEKIQYYIRESKSEKTGKYIKKSNYDLVYALSQKRYYCVLLKYLSREIMQINKMLECIPEASITTVHEYLPDDIQGFVQPIFHIGKIYAREWQAKQYEPMVYNSNTQLFQTRRGESVRSKSEVLIANYLDDYHVPYHYEYPISLGGNQLRPDFYILNVRTGEEYYWEHFGKMGDPSYQMKAFQKIARYQEYGFYQGKNILYTFESEKWAISTKTISDMIETYLI